MENQERKCLSTKELRHCKPSRCPRPYMYKMHRLWKYVSSCLGCFIAPFTWTSKSHTNRGQFVLQSCPTRKQFNSCIIKLTLKKMCLDNRETLQNYSSQLLDLNQKCLLLWKIWKLFQTSQYQMFIKNVLQIFYTGIVWLIM
jgi:hypothetical protein